MSDHEKPTLFLKDNLIMLFYTHPGYSRLDFRRLPGPVFDPPQRETTGRVTHWPCLWRNWKIDNLGISDVTGSETGLQFSYLFG